MIRDKLREHRSDLADELLLLANLNHYYEKRLNPTICELMQCLKTRDMPSNSALKFASSLLKRLFGVEVENNQQSEDARCARGETSRGNNSSNSDNSHQTMSLSEELRHRLINENFSSSTQSSQQVNFDKLKDEFKIYKSTGNPTKNISSLIMALDTIKPTSTESKRTFSVAGNFCTKIRSRLSDKSLSALVFLKYHFKNPST